MLYPDNAAIIVLKTNIIDFNETNAFLVDAIVLYDIISETGTSKEFQLYVGRIEFDTRILYDTQFTVNFDKDNGN